MSNTRATPVTQPDQGHALPCSDGRLVEQAAHNASQAASKNLASHSLYTLLTRAPPRPRPRPLSATTRPSEQGRPACHTLHALPALPHLSYKAARPPPARARLQNSTRAGYRGGTPLVSPPQTSRPDAIRQEHGGKK